MQTVTPLQSSLAAIYPNIRHNNELHLEFMGINGMNSHVMEDSSSRGTMFATQVAQRIVTNHCDPILQSTGLEFRMKDSTIKAEMPANGNIIRVIPKYKQGPFVTSMPLNPEDYVFYHNEDTGEMDYFTIPQFKSYDQQFGFKLVPNEDNMSLLHKGQSIPKGTVFADTPAVKQGTYCPGFHANVAFMSDLGAAEDGFIARRGFLKKLEFNLYQTYIVEFGLKTFPLFIHGGKIHPEIGDYLSEDALLMALREFDTSTLPVDTSINDVKDVDNFFDKLCYARPGHKGRIIDIEVIKNTSIDNLPEECCVQPERYHTALLGFYKELNQFEMHLEIENKKKYGQAISIPYSPRLSALFVTAHTMVRQNGADSGKVKLLYKKENINQYRYKFTVEYTMIPQEGYKFTGLHGDKGVVTSIRDDADMPVDADGNVADFIIDAGSRFARMIPGSLFEHGLSGITRDIAKHHISIPLGFTEGMSEEYFVTATPRHAIDAAYDKYLTLLYLVSNEQFDFYKGFTHEKKALVLYDICKDKQIYLNLNINNQTSLQKTMPILRNVFNPVIGPVTFRDIHTKEVVVTENAVQIAPMYMFLLDKIGDEWMAVSTAPMHMFGMLAPVNKGNKFQQPWRNTPAKAIGETEGRLYVAYAGRRAFAEMFDRSNNMEAQICIVDTFLSADEPCCIDRLVDRSRIPYGRSKALQLFKHMMACRGIQSVYIPEKGLYK